MSSNQIEFIIVDDIMEEFQKFLGDKYKVIVNEGKWESSCDFGIIADFGCPMIYGKYGWTECGKCCIHYNCNNGGTKEFNDLLKKHNCNFFLLLSMT
jgi:hypothetical protein